MGKNGAEVVELPYYCSIKVHRLMCLELKKFIDRISEIFSAIEAARPRCSTGIRALCSLHASMHKAKLLIQYCSESSKFYMAITADRIVLRCEKIRNNLELSLSQIQSMVPSLLAAKISGIVHDIRGAKFPLEPAEDEAGKVVLALLRQDISVSNSVNNLELEAIQLAALKLKIMSPFAVSMEKSSIRKLLVKVLDTDPTKKKILKYLLYLLRKYGEIIGRDQNDGNLAQQDESSYLSIEHESHDEPPEEYKCPISMRLMYDPVIIASGRTFERFWIEKWFSEGNNTCPITHEKLDHLSLTPNSVMKGLISKWSSNHGITIPDPSLDLVSLTLLNNSSNSIASFASSMNHLNLQISSVSISSSATNSGSELFDDNCDDILSSQLTQMNAEPQKIYPSADSYGKNAEPQKIYPSADSYGKIFAFLSTLAALSWGSQCKAVEDVKNQLQDNSRACDSTISYGYIKPLINFLKVAQELRDVKAQREAAEVLLAILSENRSEMPPLDEDAIYVLASYLDSEITGNALAIMEVLSCQSNYKFVMVSSGVLPPILKVLDTQISEFHTLAMKILCNLSCTSDIGYHIVYLDCIPKLVPFLGDCNLAQYCIKIIKNLCNIAEARISVAKTSLCIGAIAKLLEIGTKEEQEQAGDILLSLCHELTEYCQPFMRESVIQSLISLFGKGNSKEKVIANELLQFLGHSTSTKDDFSESSSIDAGLSQGNSSDSGNLYKKKKRSFNPFRFLRRKISVF